MRLADFIRENMESILVEWEAFAATNTPAARAMTSLELRDHAEAILEAIAKDISTPQSSSEQKEKSLGNEPVSFGAPETAAESHAVLRGRSGFDINQLVAEFRALRASVLRLWGVANENGARNLDDVIRFNEAIDQALTESVTYYSALVERSRALLLGMVGHDMRSPLNTIHLAASHLRRVNAGEAVSQLAERIAGGSERLASLLDDLVDFNRSRLGLGIHVSPKLVDLANSFTKEVELLRFGNPGNLIDLQIEGDVTGNWDERRLQQVLSNLVLNAVKYGTPRAPIQIRLTGVEDCVNFEVLNAGRFKSQNGVEQLFEPLRRGPDVDPRSGADSLGIGLYIAREIVIAHGGEITVHTHAAATVFIVSLPRKGPAEPLKT